MNLQVTGRRTQEGTNENRGSEAEGKNGTRRGRGAKPVLRATALYVRDMTHTDREYVVPRENHARFLGFEGVELNLHAFIRLHGLGINESLGRSSKTLPLDPS